MQGIWLEDQKLSFREDIPEPEPAEGEAVIQIRLAGICSPDLELVKGYYANRVSWGMNLWVKWWRSSIPPRWSSMKYR
jgi:D-arabinose 1-dehydrogenase-like Zn-dependent alcohol dehydrogenase